MNNLPDLLIRADAGPAIGSGHVMRGFALAQAWKALGGRAALSGECSPALRRRLEEAGLEVRAPAGDGLAAGGWAFIDGYGFAPEYLEAARAKARTLVVDDYGHRARLPADVVLNQNAGAERFAYPPDAALFLLGPRFALLRPEFAEAPRRAANAKPRVLVTLGGSDPDNVTETVVRALAPLAAELDLVVVIGPDNPHEAALRGLTRDLRKGVPDLRALMLQCDAAVVAGGVTALECAAAGLPTVLLSIAENQKRQVQALGAAGAGLALGEERGAKALAEAARSAAANPALGAAGRALVDGSGARRVAGVLRALTAPKLTVADCLLRPAAASDCWNVWRLNNEPSVRARSFATGAIPAETHERWYAEQLRRPDARFFVLEVAGAHAAHARYTRSASGEAEVHFAVASAFRGKGLGTLALSLSRGPACRELGVSRVKALVLEPNDPSARAFLSAGYHRAGSAVERGQRCSVFEASCS